MKNSYKTIYLAFLYLISINIIMAQNLDFDQLKNSTALKIGGGVSANSTFYNSNSRSSREPFVYNLNGNLNLNWLTFSMPISYGITNQGSSLGYDVPFNFNRLSLNPKYKWINAHIGHANMTFSPFTLNGHTFTGIGLDLTPKGKFSYSLMYGKMLKAVEFDPNNSQTIPSFSRIGTGAKINYKHDLFTFGISQFYAKDDVNSIKLLSDSILKPKQNLVLELDTKVQISPKFDVSITYASTSISNDIRAEKSKTKASGSLSGLFFNNLSNIEHYNAIKTSVNYQLEKTNFSLGYEKTDDNYSTLGAYYFTNDLENYTISGNQILFKEKVNLGVNFGLQKNDLKNTKDEKNQRIISSVKLNYKASEKLNFNGMYSNLTSNTNVRANQFDEINQIQPRNFVDSLNYRQLSQNANMNVNYSFGKKEKAPQKLDFSYNFSASANEQNSIIRIGQASNIHNFSTKYSLNLMEYKTQINTSFNYTKSYVNRLDTSILGPTFTFSRPLFKDKIKADFSTAFNTEKNNESKSTNMNFKLSFGYNLKEKHSFNLNMSQFFRNSENKEITNNVNELTINFGYSYNFNLLGNKK